MYLFDLEDFDCTKVPNNWENYTTAIKATIDGYSTCVSNYINSNINLLPNKVVIEINDLLNKFLIAYDDTILKFNNMMDILSVAPLNCFDKTTYYDYIESYNNFKTIGQRITGLIVTKGAIGIESNVVVESIKIYPQDSIKSINVSKLTGVYLRNIDNGSEFIGKVRVIVNNN